MDYVTRLEITDKLKDKQKQFIDDTDKVDTKITLYEYVIDRDFKFSVKKIEVPIKEVHKYEKSEYKNNEFIVVLNGDKFSSNNLNVIYCLKEEPRRSYMRVEFPTYYSMYCLFNESRIKKNFIDTVYHDLETERNKINEYIDTLYDEITILDDNMIKVLLNEITNKKEVK